MSVLFGRSVTGAVPRASSYETGVITPGQP